MADLWRVTVQYVMPDGSVQRRTFEAPKISVQVFDDVSIPRRGLVLCFDGAGQLAESFQCDVASIHKERVTDGPA